MRKFVYNPKKIQYNLETGTKCFCLIAKAAFYEDVIQFLVIATACDSEEAQEVNLILEEIPVSSELLERIAKYMYPGADRGIVILDSDECIHFSWHGYVKYCDGRLKIDWDNIEVRETPEAYRNRRIAQKFGLLA